MKQIGKKSNDTKRGNKQGILMRRGRSPRQLSFSLPCLCSDGEPVMDGMPICEDLTIEEYTMDDIDQIFTVGMKNLIKDKGCKNS